MVFNNYGDGAIRAHAMSTTPADENTKGFLLIPFEKNILLSVLGKDLAPWVRELLIRHHLGRHSLGSTSYYYRTKRLKAFDWHPRGGDTVVAF